MDMHFPGHDGDPEGIRVDVDLTNTHSATSSALERRMAAAAGRPNDQELIEEPVVTMPQLRPVIFLRGAGVPAEDWKRIREAMWAHGWATEQQRSTAWHLARGGVPVVMLDFSAGRDVVTASQVRAKYAADPKTDPAAKTVLAALSRCEAPAGSSSPGVLADLVERALDAKDLHPVKGSARQD